MRSNNASTLNPESNQCLRCIFSVPATTSILVVFLAICVVPQAAALPVPSSHLPLVSTGVAYSLYKSICRGGISCTSVTGIHCKRPKQTNCRSIRSVLLHGNYHSAVRQPTLRNKNAHFEASSVPETRRRNLVDIRQPQYGELVILNTHLSCDETQEDKIDGEERESDELKKQKDVEKEVAQQIEQEKGELQAAVQEVREAVQEVSQSAKNLGETVINKGPGIFTRLVTLLFSEEMRNDVLRRRKCYVSDWTDAFRKKRQVVPAVLFLYFACLAPTVSFGTISSEITNGSIGVVEFLLSCGIAGMAYSILCGQPMAFLAPTGLTLAFISGLFRFCHLRGLPFFPVYAWVGLWTCLFMTLLGISGSSKLIRYCTRFTDEVFNGLLSVNFIYEATSSLKRNFANADPMNLTMPFVSLSMALGTFFSTMTVVKFEATKFFSSKIRTSIKNFGPVSVILLFTVLNRLPWCQKFHVPTLSVPDTFQLAGGRNFLVGLRDIPVTIRIICALPAFLLTCLFFMDQNISVRLVNNPDNKLQKGEAYNLDMVALGLITGGLSIFGLPWMCGATVQSMNHVRALAETELNEETKQIEIVTVTETRVTGFIIHAMLASTIMLLPLIKYLPIPVVSGVFLFLGRKLMTGNTFFKRITDAFAETKRLPDENPVHILGRKKMNIYTGVQVLCLLGLFGFKQFPAVTIFFPAMIAVLMFIRAFVLPIFFTEEEFIALGDTSPT